jgi:hypothetical protein
VVLALVPVLGGDSAVWEARWRQVYDKVSAVDGQGPDGADPAAETRAVLGVDLPKARSSGLRLSSAQPPILAMTRYRRRTSQHRSSQLRSCRCPSRQRT